MGQTTISFKAIEMMTMGARIDPNMYVGMQYGVYMIDNVMSERDKWNHAIYRGTCIECGYQRFGTIYDFKNKIVETCKHIGLLTDEQFNAWYDKNKIKCLYCGKYIPFNWNDSVNDYKTRQFCNRSCAASYCNKGVRRNYKKGINYDALKQCLNCGKEIPRQNKYCSSKCQSDFQYKTYIERWKIGLENGIKGKYSISSYIKRYLMEKYDGKCSKCGWNEINPYTGKVPLEVHHKDGDYTNNDENNLDLLCPNCHSLTATYKAANMGNGRKERKKYT